MGPRYSGTILSINQFTVSSAGGLSTLPTVISTGWLPDASPAGTWKFTCVTPTSPGGVPINRIGASTPATVTRAVCVGRGRLANGVCVPGAAPVAIAGDTAPV